ncbi:hypothetical protein Q1695_015541 [Nippostrongylus brasiliensis]|nr:hypothetical protein Q1695_015541 [Nippostrongylus brasiliensis]
MTIVLETDNDDDDEETRCLRIRISERNGRADGWEWSADGERMEMSGGMGKTWAKGSGWVNYNTPHYPPPNKQHQQQPHPLSASIRSLSVAFTKFVSAG